MHLNETLEITMAEIAYRVATRSLTIAVRQQLGPTATPKEIAARLYELRVLGVRDIVENPNAAAEERLASDLADEELRKRGVPACFCGKCPTAKPKEAEH